MVPVHPESAGAAPVGLTASRIVATATPVTVLRGVFRVHFHELPTGPLCLVLELIAQKSPGLREDLPIQALLVQALPGQVPNLQILNRNQSVDPDNPRGGPMERVCGS